MRECGSAGVRRRRTDATEALADCALWYALARVSAVCDVSYRASARVLKNACLVCEARLRRYTMHQTREYADLDLVVSAKDETGHSIATAEHDVPVVADVRLEDLEPSQVSLATRRPSHGQGHTRLQRPQRCTRGSLELFVWLSFPVRQEFRVQADDRHAAEALQYLPG
jgi:hypothetical protein